MSNSSVGDAELDNNRQSGGQPIFAVRHYASFSKNGDVKTGERGSETLTCTNDSNGVYTVYFNSGSGPGNDNYIALVTSLDGDADHIIAVTNKNANDFTVEQYDMEDFPDARDDNSNAPFSVLVIY